MVQWFKTSPSTPGWELKSHMPSGQKKTKLKIRSNIVANSIKTLKIVQIKKKSGKEKDLWLPHDSDPDTLTVRYR